MKKQIIEKTIDITTSYAKEHKSDSKLDNKTKFNDVLCNFIKRIDSYFIDIRSTRVGKVKWIKNLSIIGLD